MPFGWEARGRDFPRRSRIVAGLSRAVVVVEAARRSGSLITARFAAEEGREIFACPGSPLDPRAEGANQLLRDGASFCTKPEDVIDAMAREEFAGKEASRGFFESDALGSPDEPLGDELDLFGETGAPSPPAELDVGGAPCGHNLGAAGFGDPRLTVDALAVRPPADVAARVAELLGPAPVSVDELARSAEAPARQVRSVLIELELAGKIEWCGGDLVSSLPSRSGDR